MTKALYIEELEDDLLVVCEACGVAWSYWQNRPMAEIFMVYHRGQHGWRSRV